jgi:hypothetical protein
MNVLESPALAVGEDSKSMLSVFIMAELSLLRSPKALCFKPSFDAKATSY